MMTSSDNILGELRGLLAQRPSFERDAAICELMAFTSRVALEQSGAWDYICAASRRGTLGAVWDDGAWCDVRAGRLWGRARKGAVSLRGTTPLKGYVLDDFIAQTHKVPCLSLDLGFLSDMLGEVLTEMLARADLSRLVWLDISNDAPGPGLIQLLSMHELPALRSLELQGLEVDDLRDVPALARLVHLGVAHCKVNDDWMRRHVAPGVMPALRSLDLNHTEVAASVWEQLGEQHGYEQMYALKMCSTWMTSREVGLCRWLPCLEWIDTIAFELHGDLQGVVYEEGLALLEDGLTGVRDLELHLVDVSQDIQAETLARLAHLPYYERLCALGLGRIWLNQDNMDALRISREVSEASGLRRFALLYVYGEKIRNDDYWQPYFEPQFDMAALTSWARLAHVQAFELALRPGHERAHRYDAEEWLLESIMSMPGLERVKLRGLTPTEINIWFVLWGKSKTLAELDTLEMLGCDLQLSGMERIEAQSIAGPVRWVFDGCASLEERALLLNSFSDAIAYGSTLLSWFNKLDLERAAAYIHEFEQDDDIW